MRAAVSCITLLLCCLGSAHAQLPDTLNPAELVNPECGPSFRLVDGLCKVEDSVAGLSAEACKAAGFKVGQDSPATCDPASREPPKPACKALPGYTAKLEAGACTFAADKVRSAAGDYVGDCFSLKSRPPGLTDPTVSIVTVTHQEDAGDDRLLTVVKGDVHRLPLPWRWPPVGCVAESGPQTQVLASTLIGHGASRYGWAYGALVMPYKYYVSSRKHTAGLPLGAYLGWRWGQSGSGLTLAAAFTVSNVTADTVDPGVLDDEGRATVTGTTSVSALSGALGMVFDVTKRPGAKPFKAGLFIGQDRVNTSPTIRYAENGKTWLAIQLGFDFTDW